MKKAFALVVMVFMLGTTAVARGGDGYYAGIEGGANLTNCSFLEQRHIDFDTGYIIDGDVGYSWCNGARLEAELSYWYNPYTLRGTNHSAEKKTYCGHMDFWSFMVNGYYDFTYLTWKCISPFVGVGAGIDFVHQSVKILGKEFGGNNTGFGWQVMAGINYDVNENVAISVEYTYHHAPLRHQQDLHNQGITFGVKKFFCL